MKPYWLFTVMTVFAGTVQAQDYDQLPVEKICIIAPKRIFEITHSPTYPFAVAARKAGHYNEQYERVLRNLEFYRSSLKYAKCKK